MISTLMTPNYGTTFPHQTLTKIHGRPNFLGLRRIEKELTANASSVTSTLGGGAHGHLGLVKSAATYNTITPGTPYVRPALPPPLIIPAGTTQHEAFRLHQEHYAEINKHNETVEVEKLLRKQLQNAIDSQYLAEFKNQYTETINQSLSQVLETLYRKYGKVKRNDVKALEKEVENMDYNLSQPLENIWSAIKELQQLATAAKCPYTNKQLVEIGLAVIKNTHDFETALLEWARKPEADQTYANLKTHFDDHLTLLMDIRGDDMQQPSFHQANLIRDDMYTEVSSMKDDIISAIEMEKENAPPMESANAVRPETNQVQLDVLTSMAASLKALTERMEAFETQAHNRTSKNQPRTSPVTDVPFWELTTNKFHYCWSCGNNPTHPSSNCTQKKEGHKDEATYANRMGGSTKRIPKRFR